MFSGQWWVKARLEATADADFGLAQESSQAFWGFLVVCSGVVACLMHQGLQGNHATLALARHQLDTVLLLSGTVFKRCTFFPQTYFVSY